MLIRLYSYRELVEYPHGVSYDLRQTNRKIIKKKENNMTMQSMDMFCSYKKSLLKNQINQRYG
jgi:hypothetical protein